MPPVTLPPTDKRVVSATVCAEPLTVYDPTPPGPPLEMMEPVATLAPQNFMPLAMVPKSTAVTTSVVDAVMEPVKRAAPVPPGQKLPTGHAVQVSDVVPVPYVPAAHT
jgi:hypothetical protein